MSAAGRLQTIERLGIIMKFLDAEFVQGFIRMADDGWQQGWHERNGGNLSYRVKPEEVELVKENFEPKEFQPIGTTVPALAGEYFLVTGSGKYFRNVSIKPEDSICMIELDDKGENYRIVWGLVNGGRPTSELPSHLMNLEVKKLQDPDYRVVYHAHTTNIIALTFVLPLEDKGIHQRTVGDGNRVPRSIPGWCGRSALDGTGRQRDRSSYLRTDEEIRSGHLGTSWNLCRRQRLRPDLRSDAYRRKIRRNSGEDVVHAAE